jgi:hypothetical protein
MIALQPNIPPTTLPTTALPLTAMAANVAAISTAGRISSTRHYAHHQPQHSSGPSRKALNSQLSQASLPTLSYRNYHCSQPPIRATCDVTAKVSKPCRRNNQQSSKHALMLIASNPPKNYAPPTTCFALQHWQTYTPGQCTPMALVPSPSNPSATCNMCLRCIFTT